MALAARTDDRPRYRLLAPLWADNDTRYPEDAELVWLGPPNEHMEPLNGAAETRMAEYLQELDRGAELKSMMDGKMFVKRHPDLADVVGEAMAERPREPRATPRRVDAPVRPDLLSPAEKRRRAAEPRQVDPASVVMPEGTKPGMGPVPILGTTYTADAQRDAR